MAIVDADLLAEMGLSAVPAEQRQALLDATYRELERRVGERLADGLSEEQFETFDMIIGENKEGTLAWLEGYVDNWRNKFEALHARVPEISFFELAAAEWLAYNRPDYPEIVAGVFADLKSELRGCRDEILRHAR